MDRHSSGRKHAGACLRGLMIDDNMRTESWRIADNWPYRFTTAWMHGMHGGRNIRVWCPIYRELISPRLIWPAAVGSGKSVSGKSTRRDSFGANLQGVNLREADLSHAELGFTIFGDTNLSGTIGLEYCRHTGPSVVDHQTMMKSWPLPVAFFPRLRLAGSAD